MIRGGSQRLPRRIKSLNPWIRTGVLGNIFGLRRWGSHSLHNLEFQIVNKMSEGKAAVVFLFLDILWPYRIQERAKHRIILTTGLHTISNRLRLNLNCHFRPIKPSIQISTFFNRSSCMSSPMSLPNNFRRISTHIKGSGYPENILLWLGSPLATREWIKHLISGSSKRPSNSGVKSLC